VATRDRDFRQFDILIVDDQAHMRAVLRDLIQKKFPGHVVADTASGRQAFKLVQEARPQLVLMDVSLPDGNGILLTGRITSVSPRTRVVIVSEYTEQTYVERALAAGALGFVAKEKIYAELPALVASALGLARPPENGRA
jgi:DNA-binding NarL/FixJ family response regulator